MSQPAPPLNEPPRPPPSGGWSSLLGLAAALLVFLGFVAYGRLAPTTYRTTAQIVLRPIGDKPLSLAPSPAPAERLRQAAIDSETLEQAAAELKLGTGAAGQAAARQRIDAKLEVTSPKPDTFDFSFREATASSTERVTNLLARHAASRAVRTLGPSAPDEAAAREAARSKSAGELAAFMAAHPELAPQTPSVVPVTPKDAPDAEVPALRAERDQIQAKLARMPEAGASSDNPFGEPTTASPEAKQLRRRLAEIDQTLAARKKAEKKQDTAPKVQPQVEREWKRLVQAVANPTVAPDLPPEPTFTVMLREATLPTAPIDPDRRMLALLGALAALVTAVALTIVQAVFSRRSAWRAAAPPTPRHGSEPPRARSEPPPHLGSESPTRISSRPPGRPASDPPRPGSEPPPQLGSEPPRHGSEPPRPGSDPPQQGGQPPQPIIGVGAATTQLVSTQLSSADPRHASSNPPAPRQSPPPTPQASSNPPPARGASSGPPAQTATGHAIPSPAPPVATEVGLAAPSPPPPAPSPSPARPTPGYDELRPAVPAIKGTLVGMAGLAQEALDRTLAARPLDETLVTPTVHATGEVEGPFAAAPSARGVGEVRSTLRPPPPEGPTAIVETTGTTTPPTPVADPKAPATPTPPEPGEPDETWVGPSRAHRRSVSAARRTTQMLGSPIPPVMRGSRPPPAERRETPTHASQAPASPTGYSYVSQRPEPQRQPTNTPPYYQTSRGSVAPQEQRSPSRDPGPSAPPVQRTRVTTHPARAGWRPDSTLDPRGRRALADQLFPLAVEACFVLGVTAVEKARYKKSRVAAELALALAEAAHPRVLLVEADFQWPSVHEIMHVDMPMAMGFSQQLRGRATAKPDAWTVVECTPSLHVLAEGIMRSPGHILSVQFEEAIQSMRGYYDVIVLDGPDTSSEIECRALANVIDGVVLVSPAAGSPDLGRGAQLFPDKRFSVVVGV